MSTFTWVSQKDFSVVAFKTHRSHPTHAQRKKDDQNDEKEL